MLTRALWCCVVFLSLLGVAASVPRMLFPGDAVTRMEPVRRLLLDGIGRQGAIHTVDALERFDGRFGAHPVMTFLHVVPGAVLLAFAPLQFSSRIRNRHRSLHRWSGRVLLAVFAVTGGSGLYFGLLMPFGGPGEAAAIALFGGWMLVAAGRAFAAIRKGDVPRHREWMVRAFAAAISISTVRVAGAVLEVTLGSPAWTPEQLFVLSVWAGWVATIGAAELWIRHTRQRLVFVR